MALQSLNTLDPDHRRTVNGKDVRQFAVYGDLQTSQTQQLDHAQPLGRVVDALVDESGRFQHLILELQGAYGGKQVLLPMAQIGVDTTHEKIYLLGLDDLQIAGLPIYHPTAPMTSAASTPDSAALPAPLPPGSVAQTPVHSRHAVHSPAQAEAYPAFTVEDSQAVETSAALESSPQLGSREVSFISPHNSSDPSPHTVASLDRESRPAGRSLRPETLPPDLSAAEQPLSHEAVSDDRETHAGESATIQLLEERIVQNTRRRKVGEVIVRKVVETEMVQVPIRREKLIIEQVGSGEQHLVSIQGDQLHSVDLVKGDRPIRQGTPEPGPASVPLSSTQATTVTGTFSSLQVAHQFLQAIADSAADCKTVSITLELADPQLRDSYQTWIDRYASIQ